MGRLRYRLQKYATSFLMHWLSIMINLSRYVDKEMKKLPPSVLGVKIQKYILAVLYLHCKIPQEINLLNLGSPWEDLRDSEPNPVPTD